MSEFINVTPGNLEKEHLCCIIRAKKQPESIINKRKWLIERFSEGHVFRKLNDKKATVFIEYAPLESAWVPIVGEKYNYIYCLWTLGEYRGKGYGKKLLDYAIKDAKEHSKSGLCALGSKKQKTWLTSTEFLKSNGFNVVDETESGYELLAISFDGTTPKFSTSAKLERINENMLTIYYDDQCPYILKSLENIQNYCKENNIPLNIIKITSFEQAKTLPCVFNNYAVFYKGKFQTVNLLDIPYLERILKN